jgi:CubicO group peptidase (beta-lactamase class C family)
MNTVHGTCDDRFAAVRAALARNLASGADIGASVAVYLDGEAVVDVWGGHVDAGRTRPWERDTIVNVFSSTKTMTALAALILADRGVVDPDAPVARYWPEFAAAGKDGIAVRQLLGHSCGLPGWDEPMTVADVLDREKATDLLARQAPWWKPGTALGYGSLTMGPLVGEVVRRATGRTLTEFFAEEVAGPLGADCHIGAPVDADHRVSPMIPSSPIRRRDPAGSIPERVFFNPYGTPQDASTTAWRRGELGGSNGHSNARGLGLVQHVLANGGEVGGIRLLSEAGCARALEVVADGDDLVLGMPLRWGMGYCVGSALSRQIYGDRTEGRRVALWGGSGGSWVLNDLDARMTVTFVMNKHVEGLFDTRSTEIVNTTYDCLALTV